MNFVSRLVVTCLCLTSLSAFAQPISPKSKLYISPMNGFETYLAAAILAKQVHLVVVLDKAKAEYVLAGTWSESDGGTSGNGSLVRPLKTRTNYSASISIVDPTTSAIVSAYSSQRSGSHDLSKEIAENLAKQLLSAMKSPAR